MEAGDRTKGLQNDRSGATTESSLGHFNLKIPRHFSFYATSSNSHNFKILSDGVSKIFDVTDFEVLVNILEERGTYAKLTYLTCSTMTSA